MLLDFLAKEEFQDQKESGETQEKTEGEDPKAIRELLGPKETKVKLEKRAEMDCRVLLEREGWQGLKENRARGAIAGFLAQLVPQESQVSKDLLVPQDLLDQRAVQESLVPVCGDCQVHKGLLDLRELLVLLDKWAHKDLQELLD